MSPRKENPRYGNEETVSSTEMPGRTRRRTQIQGGNDGPERGRRLFQSLQSNRQGTPSHSGAHEPSPRTQEHESYGHEPLPSERGASRGKRIAWGLGALTAIGGAGAFFYRRRRQGRRGRREEW